MNNICIQLWAYLSSPDNARWRASETWQEFMHDMLLRGHSTLLRLPDVDECKSITDLSMGGLHRHQVLLTDDPAVCQRFCAAGWVVFGLGDPSGFAEAMSVFGGVEALSAAYMEMLVCHHVGVPFIVGSWDQYRLRECTVSDFPYLQDICMKDQFEMFPGAGSQDLYALYQAYIREQYPFYGFGLWTIAGREDRPVGLCGFSLQTEVPDLGYIVRRDLRGRHIALKACLTALRYAEEELGMEQVYLYADQDNRASVSLAEKLGFTLKDTLAGRSRFVLTFNS